MEVSLNTTVSVVVVTCGVRNYLWDCLDSLRQQSCGGLEVIVVDNSADPGFAARLAGYAPSVKTIVNPRNLYYGVSLNRGIDASRSEFVLCLNDDVVLDKDFIIEAVKGFSVDPRVGMVSGKIMRSDARTLDSTGLSLSVWGTAVERGYGCLDRRQFERSSYVFGVSGAVAFYRRTMLEDIRESGAIFDPCLRMFYEDLDLCWRARRRGWKGYYIPLAKACHVRGGSVRPAGTGKAIARRYIDDGLLCDLMKNRYKVLKKNMGGFGLCARFFPIALYDIPAWMYLFLFRPQVIRLLRGRVKTNDKGVL